MTASAPPPAQDSRPRLVGRSSSSFTRVARIFAAELGVELELDVVRDLMSAQIDDYGGNPALKLPVLRAASGVWFGALNICRELSRSSDCELVIVWPEDLSEPLLANAQELTVHALGTEVTLVMSQLGGALPDGAHQSKLRASLLNVLSWLDANVGAAIAALPAHRSLSYFEVTLFCLVTHLEFRAVLPVSDYPQLLAFCHRFGERESARSTPYRFDTR